MAARKKTTQKRDTALKGVLGTAQGEKKFLGEEVSLDLSKETYFGVGDMWLSPSSPVGFIPKKLSPLEQDAVETALRQKVLVLGREFLPPVKKDPATLDKYMGVVNTPMSTSVSNEFKLAFSRLSRAKTEGGYTALEIYQYCLSKEKAQKNRKVVTDYLTLAINAYQGPVSAYVVPEEFELGGDN